MMSAQSDADRTQRALQSLTDARAKLEREEAKITEKISSARRAAATSKSASTVQSKLRDVARLEHELGSIVDKKASRSKQIADKMVKLASQQQRATQDHIRLQKRALDELRRSQEAMRREQDVRLDRYLPPFGPEDVALPHVTYDAFISHASEDKDEIVRPLAEKLRERGASVWYDEFRLAVGDSLWGSINHGLARSRFGIVVLSQHFFAKRWTQAELNGLAAKELNGGKTILPLWHKVTKDEVLSFSPILADKFALNTAVHTVDEIVMKLLPVLRPDAAG